MFGGLFSKRAKSKPNSIPPAWKQSLNQCNFWLARRVIGEMLEMLNHDAKQEGKEAIYEIAFVQGWKQFAAEPCYATAVAWLDAVPEHTAILVRSFVDCSPGGNYYSVGSKTARDFQFGPYNLSMAPETCGRLTELSAEEYTHIPHRLPGEVIYHAPTAGILFRNIGFEFAVIIGVIKGRIYKITCSMEVENWESCAEAVQVILSCFEFSLGTPTEEQQALFRWDSGEDGNVILQGIGLGNSFAVNVFLTAGHR